MNKIYVNDSIIGGDRTFVIAEMSGNHNQDKNRAIEIVRAAKYSGADALKIQTYRADTITLDCDGDMFRAQKGSPWEGTTLYKLYGEAYTPWEWHKDIFEEADRQGLVCFSSPFDFTAIDFLEELGCPIYKIASYEITDIPLIRKAAKTKKPVIMSTGLASESDIKLAVDTCRQQGNNDIVLLKCTSAYPAPFGEMNIRMVPDLSERFACVSGLSDHTLGSEVAVASVALGARVVEKHLTLDRKDGGVDSAFSMEPEEFKNMVSCIRNVEAALGTVSYTLTDSQMEGRKYCRSLYVSKDVRKGERVTPDNVKSVRPGGGLEPRFYDTVMGSIFKIDVKKGVPLSWDMTDCSGPGESKGNI
ncbi:MAG: pseudaminic acid synthase [Lachnospiraceae bacterium]|nr:pseudaminic acid synthase [Lachnospiraceae bacterium]